MASRRYTRHIRNLCTETEAQNGRRYRQYVRSTGGYLIGVGTFDSKARAQLARKLYEHWQAQGFNDHQIPARPKTVDAI